MTEKELLVDLTKTYLSGLWLIAPPNHSFIYSCDFEDDTFSICIYLDTYVIKHSSRYVNIGNVSDLWRIISGEIQLYLRRVEHGKNNRR